MDCGITFPLHPTSISIPIEAMKHKVEFFMASGLKVGSFDSDQ